MPGRDALRKSRRRADHLICASPALPTKAGSRRASLCQTKTSAAASW